MLEQLSGAAGKGKKGSAATKREAEAGFADANRPADHRASARPGPARAWYDMAMSAAHRWRRLSGIVAPGASPDRRKGAPGPMKIDGRDWIQVDQQPLEEEPAGGQGGGVGGSRRGARHFSMPSQIR